MSYELSLSARAFSQVESPTRSRSAARWYFAFSSGVTRTWSWAEAVAASFGLPLGRFGFSSMPELWHTQIILDKPPLA